MAAPSGPPTLRSPTSNFGEVSPAGSYSGRPRPIMHSNTSVALQAPIQRRLLVQRASLPAFTMPLLAAEGQPQPQPPTIGWRDRLKEGLHSTQVVLLERARDRRATWVQESPASRKVVIDRSQKTGPAAAKKSSAGSKPPSVHSGESPNNASGHSPHSATWSRNSSPTAQSGLADSSGHGGGGSSGHLAGQGGNGRAHHHHGSQHTSHGAHRQHLGGGHSGHGSHGSGHIVHGDGAGSDDEIVQRHGSCGRRRSQSVDDRELVKRRIRVSKKEGRKGFMNKSLAYMGVDWYTIVARRQKLSYVFIIQNMYYWCYAVYVVCTVVIGGVLIWLLEPEGGMTLPQTIYTAAACVSQSGLAVVDWSKRSDTTYVLSFLLILLGSAPLLHCVPVILREHSFRMQTRMTARLQRCLSGSSEDSFENQDEDFRFLALRRCYSEPDVPLPHESPQSESPADESRRSHHEILSPKGPQSSPGSSFMGNASVLSLDDPSGVSKKEKEKAEKSKRKKHSDALENAHRLEYKALRMILKIMLGYWLVCHILGFILFYCYFEFFDGDIQAKFYADGLRPHYHALYLTVSAFQNNGLVMTPSSVMDFALSPILLNAVGALIMAGNTGLPIMMRLITTVLERQAKQGSERQQVLDFLLEHPRRCFTHLFPAVHTLWLLLVLLSLNVITTGCMLLMDHDSPAMINLSPEDKFWNAFFQSVSCRTAGLNSVNIAYLSQGTTFLFAVMMYLATTPTVVTMRFSAVTGAKGGRTELDITGRMEGIDEEIIKGDDTLKAQARRYLTQDVTYLTLTVFFICCLEQDQFTRSAKDISPDSDGIYGDFTFFKVIFELASAYGTCGLSLGYQNQTASFSGMWCTTSQMLLVGVMILGRLRGLPDSIDPSVRVAMSGTQDVHQQDKEHWFIHT